jgi:hypothetical protein
MTLNCKVCRVHYKKAYNAAAIPVHSKSCLEVQICFIYQASYECINIPPKQKSYQTRIIARKQAK